MLIPRVVYDVARELITEFGEFDDGKIYVDADRVSDAVNNHENATDEWFDWLDFVISKAQFEITWPYEFANGYHDSCPYDCDRCHDDEICTCGNCERLRTERAEYEEDEDE